MPSSAGKKKIAAAALDHGLLINAPRPDALRFILFFNDTATAEIYTLSLHDALPISRAMALHAARSARTGPAAGTLRRSRARPPRDRKSTRLNSSHSQISYAVFCLKKKNKQFNAHHMIKNNKTNT